MLVQGGLQTEEEWVESVFAFWVSLLLKRRRNIERKFGKMEKKSEITDYGVNCFAL